MKREVNTNNIVVHQESVGMLTKSEVRSYFCNGDLSKPPKTRSPVKAGLRDPIILIR
ncbi:MULTISPECIES: hypothetical protein [Okeania]|uniref:hypothetical protein n=1 Tax=Okeania TaxID=1458928 RepID=UPI001374CB40|nr:MULTISPECIES: hypothetical protein [Okeania]NES74344.1 hypothetical protein [Okeania sp. SIO1H4]NES90486.1 hypothetical protein [Okeania sp. SIO2B9]NET18365.1 hypothetical protein [Okeania sp. SIO1H5]NET75977.1 hypothetical protein [Okeania sp. SIO1F9]NET92224.1 hypothetical protein [Okeania sp. SIO1H2]